MKTEHIIILAFIIVFVGLAFMFVLKGVQIQAYQQGVNDCLFSVLEDVRINDFTRITYIENNQTITKILVEYQG